MHENGVARRLGGDVEKIDVAKVDRLGTDLTDEEVDLLMVKLRRRCRLKKIGDLIMSSPDLNSYDKDEILVVLEKLKSTKF